MGNFKNDTKLKPIKTVTKPKSSFCNMCGHEIGGCGGKRRSCPYPDDVEDKAK